MTTTICNRCRDLLMMTMNLIDIAVLIIKGFDYRCIIIRISKNEAINLMQNVDLMEKSRTLQSIKDLFSYIKMGKIKCPLVCANALFSKRL